MNQPDSNPKTRVGGMHKLPFHLIPPRALAHVALCFADGGFKYQPYNWHVEGISASVYYGAMLRHIFAWWCGEEYAEDGHLHLAHAVCCLLMVLDVQNTGLFVDNRPPPIGESFSELIEGLSDKIPGLRDRPNTKYDLHDIPKAPKEIQTDNKTYPVDLSWMGRFRRHDDAIDAMRFTKPMTPYRFREMTPDMKKLAVEVEIGCDNDATCHHIGELVINPHRCECDQKGNGAVTVEERIFGKDTRSDNEWNQ